ESLLQRGGVIARPVVSHAVAFDHHLGRAFEDDAGPDMRPVDMHRYLDFLDYGAARLEISDSVTHFPAGGLVADRMIETLLQERNAQAPHISCQRLHVVADPSIDRARIVRIRASDGGEKPGDVFRARTNWPAMVDRIGDRHPSGHRHQTPARLEPEYATPSGRRTNGSPLVPT